MNLWISREPLIASRPNPPIRRYRELPVQATMLIPGMPPR